MANDLMERIQQAERGAEQQRAQAALEAREILKGVEEASLASQRDAQAQGRELAAQKLEQAQAAIDQEIQGQQAQSTAARETERAAAQQRVDQAAAWIFERIVEHGNR